MPDTAAPRETLSGQDAALRFEDLQRKLLPLWDSIHQMSMDEQTIVVVPSITVDSAMGSVVQAYEERFLFLLLLLRQPHARMIYVTSQPIQPCIVDYYMGLMPGIIGSHAKGRLYLLSPLDGSLRPLTLKLLERPRFIERIRSLILDPDRAHLVPYNTTELERELALQLEIPMFGADPKFFHFGTKTGCRRLFAEEDVPHPIGFDNCKTAFDVIEAIQKIRAKKPHATQMIVKLNEGVSGEGNAVVDMQNADTGAVAVERRLQEMRFELKEATYENYFAKLNQRGGVVEEMIVGEEVRSPSVQLRITPLGELQLLSTHDQMLGGPSGQSYIGARFPADSSYASLISEQAVKIGNRLAREGVIGRFAVDFVVVRRPDGHWDAYAIEINLRKGGTTHPFLTLQFLTDGYYDPQRAQFVAPSGRTKYFVASDKIESPAYRSLTPDDLFDLVVRKGLHFNQSTQIGVVFHMISAISEHGRLGLTAVGDSHEQAYQIYQRTVKALDEEAELALKARPSP